MTNVTGTSGITGLGAQSQTLDMNNQNISNIEIFSLGVLLEESILSGAIALSQTAFFLDTENDDATDELNNITGGSQGDMIIVTGSTSTARDPTLQDTQTGAGELLMEGNFTIDVGIDTIQFIHSSNDTWRELSRSNNS